MENKNRWHNIYEESEHKEDIDNIFDLVHGYCNKNGIKLAMDNRAEEFVGNIMKYISQSKEEE